MNVGTLILGLLNGLTIGLLAAGFVLVYKSNKFLNLAHAQLGALSALLLAKFVNDVGLNFWAAVALCLPLGVAVGVLVERFVVRTVRQRTSSPVRLLMLTIGISQLLLALTFVPFFTPDVNSGKSYPQPFSTTVRVGGVTLGGMSLISLVVVPGLLAALTYFLGCTTTGKQIRAAANNPEAARLCGISPDRVGTVTWGLAGGLSTVSAILNGPTSSSSNPADIGPELLLLTMGAAAFGAFTSIPAAVGGGLALGVAYQVIAAQTSNAGYALLGTFAMTVLVILVRGNAIGKVFAASGAAIPERPVLRVPAALRSDPLVKNAGRLLGLGSLAVAAVLPQLPYLNSEGNQFLLVLVVVYALVGMSVTMLTGWGGQVSLGQFALVGLGAYLTARWAAEGWNLTAVIIVVGLIGAAVAALVGLPAVRVPGLTLAVTTLGFAVICPQYLFLQPLIGGPSPYTTPVDRPNMANGVGPPQSQASVYYLALLALVGAFLAASALRKSTAGRVILAVRDNERASAAFGVTPMTVKLSLLALSGFMAAAAGVFWALAWQRVSPVQFGAATSTAILAVPVVGGLGSLGGAVAAAALLFMSTFFIGPHVSGLFGSFGNNIGFLLFLGGILVVGAMVRFPHGIAGLVQAKWQAYLDKRAARLASRTVDGSELPLVVHDVALHFGGVTALAGVEIEVHPGEIVGLIGPNGAGKTTLMNVISGLQSPERGSVKVFGNEVADLPADVRAGYGLARSFQDASLFAGLSVSEILQVPLSRKPKTGMLSAMLGAPWAREFDRETRKEAEKIMERFGLTPFADSMAGELSTGTRRICDLAAQVAARPKIILLDEPTGGVAQREAEAFGPLLRSIRDELDCAVLIIEHDMPLLMALCDRVYAMEAGQVIAEGTPTEIRHNPRVIASYLGTDATAIDRSGRAPSGSRRPRRSVGSPTPSGRPS